MTLDHAHARSHHAGELEHGDACSKRVGRERRAEVVDTRRPCDAGGAGDLEDVDPGRPAAGEGDGLAKNIVQRRACRGARCVRTPCATSCAGPCSATSAAGAGRA